MNPETRLANRYFLVVDDEAFVRGLVARFLKQAGAADVVEASDGAAAIEAIVSYEMAFDAIITDISMEPVNGLALLRTIRSGAKGLKRNTPVLVLTAHADSALVAEALALDADAFVVKPVGQDALVDRVCRIVERTIPLRAAASYGAVASDGSAYVPADVVAAPAGKQLEAEATGAGPTLSEAHAQGDARYAAALSNEAALSARRVPLDLVRPNSILAQNLSFGAPPKLLLAAPMILTSCWLDRLRDLRSVHDTFEQIFVVEPVS